MYTINLRNDNPEGVKKPTLILSEARCVEVKKGNVKETYKDQERIVLPSLPSGDQIAIKAWATCKADRPNAERVRITHLGGRPARLDVRNPLTGLAQFVNQHVYVAWCCIVAVICSLSVVVRKLYLGYYR